jgi:hypothetical protein
VLKAVHGDDAVAQMGDLEKAVASKAERARRISQREDSALEAAKKLLEDFAHWPKLEPILAQRKYEAELQTHEGDASTAKAKVESIVREIERLLGHERKRLDSCKTLKLEVASELEKKKWRIEGGFAARQTVRVRLPRLGHRQRSFALSSCRVGIWNLLHGK